jgi:hypothetical protein
MYYSVLRYNISVMRGNPQVELSPSHKENRRVLATLLAMRWYERATRRYRLRATRRGWLLLDSIIAELAG